MNVLSLWGTKNQLLPTPQNRSPSQLNLTMTLLNNLTKTCTVQLPLRFWWSHIKPTAVDSTSQRKLLKGSSEMASLVLYVTTLPSHWKTSSSNATPSTNWMFAVPTRRVGVSGRENWGIWTITPPPVQNVPAWKCQYCDYFESTHDIGTNDHTPCCDNYTLPCPNQCEIGTVPRCQADSHLLECPLQLVECEFAGAGCAVKVPRRDLVGHMTESAQHHLMTATLLNLRLTRELHQKLEEKDQQIVDLQKQVKEQGNNIKQQG